MRFCCRPSVNERVSLNASLMVEVIEPHGGKVFDPACGSGGMFVQLAQFIEEHRKELKNNDSGVFVYGAGKDAGDLTSQDCKSVLTRSPHLAAAAASGTF